MATSRFAIPTYSPPTAGVEAEEDPVLQVIPYREGFARLLLWYIVGILSGGISLLIGYWMPVFALQLYAAPCNLNDATHFLLSRKSGNQGVEKLASSPASSRCWNGTYHPVSVDEPAVLELNLFSHRHVRYIYRASSHRFERVCGLDVETSLSTIRAVAAASISDAEKATTRITNTALYGPNIIDVEVKSYMALLFSEVLSPFYVFQIFAIILWIFEQYFYYAGCIFLVSVASIIITLVDTRRNACALRDMVKSHGTARRLDSITDSEATVIDAAELVPGDIFEVEEGMTVPCDAILIKGGCVLNEGMLTGESVPITKTAIVSEGRDAETIYNVERHKPHTIFGGTEVVQNRTHQVFAVVLRTAFDTSKGQLIRSILYPKGTPFRFYEDGLRFLMVLAMFAACGLVYSIIILINRGAGAHRIALRALDLITIIVPPALPAAMTIGTMYAIDRLKRVKIYCISPPRVNVSGKLKLICFDKTGTLTEDGLQLSEVAACANNEMTQVSLKISYSQFVEDHTPLLYALASCHSLTLMRNPKNVSPDADFRQALIGDPLEVQLFEFSKWTLVEPSSSLAPSCHRSSFKAPGPAQEHIFVATPLFAHQAFHLQARPQPEVSDFCGLSIIKEYTFSSHEQRMTVLAAEVSTQQKESKSIVHIYVKGAPEKVKALCSPATLPATFDHDLTNLTSQGLRVLAIAGRTVGEVAWEDACRMQRHEVEADMTFLGFVCFQNRVKPETAPVLKQLRAAHIRTLMITGDNIKTACSVAYESAMVPHGIPMYHAYWQDNNGLSTLRFLPDGVNHDDPHSDFVQIKASQSSALPLGLEHVEFPKLRGESGASRRWIPTRPEHAAIAITGSEFAKVRQYGGEDYTRMILSATVFARMSPDQKTQLIEDLIKLGFCVGMCGDGANDCGALKAAHVGISLSEAEASVAAPFTSRTPDIRCVPTLIREGRAALVTSFSCFKFMALYSFIEFGTALILYWINSNLGDFQYLYIDMFLILSLAVVLGRQEAYPHLDPRRPAGSLVAPTVLVSIVGQVLIHLGFLVLVLKYTEAQSWFEPLDGEPNEPNIKCYENTALFTFSTFEYVAVAIALSISKPYRAPTYTNYAFVGCVLALLALNSSFIIQPGGFSERTLELLLSPSMDFRLSLIGFIVVNMMASWLWERVSNTRFVKQCIRMCIPKKEYKNQYKRLARDVIKDNWFFNIANPRESSSSC